MLDETYERLKLGEAFVDTFADSLQSFADTLPPQELAILMAILDSATDPWTKSLDEPPVLTAEESAALEEVISTEKQI